MNDKALPQNLWALIAEINAEGVTGYQRYARIKRYLDYKARETATPLIGTFELTPVCNLECKMCYVHLNKEQMQGSELLSVEVWKDLMRQAIQSGMMYATLTGGECLTYPGFKELYLFLQSEGIQVNVLTNGLLLNEEILAFFRQKPPAYMQITLYGMSDEAYDKVTGRRCFQTVYENILRLAATDIAFVVAITPNPDMDDGLEMLRALHARNIPFVINSGLIQPRPETGRQICESVLDMTVEMMKLQNELRGSAVREDCGVIDNYPEVSTSGHKRYGILCGAGNSAFCITWQGIMQPCNSMFQITEEPLKNSFAESWRNLNQKTKAFPIPAECGGCTYERVCKHCICEHLSGAPYGHANPEVCEWGKRMVHEGVLELS